MNDKKIVLVGNPKTGIDLFGGRTNTFISCDTALKGKDKTIITLLTPSDPTKLSWFDKIRGLEKNVPIVCWIDESEDTVLEKAEKIIELFGITPVSKETLKRLANAGVKGAEAGNLLRRVLKDVNNNKKIEEPKEKKKPIKQPCNPASRKFNKEFWR